MQRPAAVIFDMDGLMLDTEPLAAQAWIDAASKLGIDFDHAVTLRLIGLNFADCRTLIRAHHGDDYPVEALMHAWGSAYDAIVEREGIVIKQGLLELMAWLEAEEVRKAVATSTRRARAESKLVHAGLFERFSVLVGGDEIAHGKPAPDIFVETAMRLGIDAADCVVLEDSEPGVRGAIAAGMTPIMIPDLHPPSAALLAMRPLVLPTLHDVCAHLMTLPVPGRVR